MGNVGQAVRREFHGPSKDSAAPFAHDRAEMVKVGKVRTADVGDVTLFVGRWHYPDPPG